MNVCCITVNESLVAAAANCNVGITPSLLTKPLFLPESRWLTVGGGLSGGWYSCLKKAG